MIFELSKASQVKLVMKGFLRLKLIVVLLFSSLVVDAQEFELPSNSSYSDALSIAKKEGKHVVLDFYTDWCGYCKKMDATTFKDEVVVKTLSNGFYVLKVNAEKGEGPSLKTRFGISGYPSFIILSGEEETLEKIVGYKNAEAFNGILLKHMPTKKPSTEEPLVSDSYWLLQAESLRKAESEYMTSLPFPKQQELKLARSCGEAKNQFDFDEMTFDISDKHWVSILELEFLLGADKVDSLASSLKDFKLLNGDELVRYVDMMYLKEEVTESHLLWINRVLRQKPSLQAKELKLYTLLKLKMTVDYRVYAKKIKKEYREGGLPESLKLLLDGK